MGKAKKIALGIGIAAILALFTGFLAWQLSDDAEQRCLLKNDEGLVCCEYSSEFDPMAKDWYTWVESEEQCNGNIVDISECEDERYYNSACNDIQQQWFGTIAIVVGLIAIIAGIIIKSNSTIEGGIIGGAIINFIMGLIAFWEWLEGWIRVLLAFLILVGLLALAYYKVRD